MPQCGCGDSAAGRADGDWKREYYARQYGDGCMTLARAARDAGVSLWEMMSYV